MSQPIGFLVSGPQVRPKVADTRQMTASLDTFKRLECTARLSDFSKSGMRVEFWRDGLGLWVGVPMRIGGFDFLIAEPKDRKGCGASIWFDPKATYACAAGLLSTTLDDPASVNFMTSHGRKIMPQRL